MNSSLAEYIRADADSYGLRTVPIDTVTVHCFACQVTGKRGADALCERSEASANYIVGYDGSIAVNVDEEKASVCSSNKANDMRAVTVEVACDAYPPYAVTDKAYAALIELLADVCQRNGIKNLVWSTDKTARVGHINGANMTVHRDYANKACPGEYLYSRMGTIAAAVNEKLEESMRYKTLAEIPEGIYRSTAERLCSEGIISGKSDGSLDLTEDMIRTLIFCERIIHSAEKKDVP